MQMNINILEAGSERKRVLQVVFTSPEGEMSQLLILTPDDARMLADGLVKQAQQAESRIITPDMLNSSVHLALPAVPSPRDTTRAKAHNRLTSSHTKKRVPCEACNYTGLATPLFEGAPARLCCECRGRGYTEHWIRDAATEVAT